MKIVSSKIYKNKSSIKPILKFKQKTSSIIRLIAGRKFYETS